MAKRNQLAPGTEPASKTPSPRPGEVEKSLDAIFRPEDGESTDLTKLDRNRSSRLLWALIGAGAFFVFLTVMAWIGFLVFKPFTGFKGQAFALTIDGPQRIALGQATTYFINWQNTASEPLANAEVRVSFPSDFTETDVEPQPNGDANTWKLGSIPYGGRGTITIKGVFTGALGTQTAVQSVATYRPASFNSDFEALATRDVQYTDTVLDGAFAVPEKSLPGDKVTMAYTIQNRGSDVMKGLQAEITLPDGFVRDASSTAQLDGKVVTFPVGDVAPGATSTVSVSGSFASGVSGDESVHGEVGTVGPDGTFLPALKTDATISVLAGDLTLNLVANGSNAGSSIGYGDMLHFAIGYENTASEDLKDVAIRIHLDPLNASGTPIAPPSANVKKPAASPVLVDWSQLVDTSSGTHSGNQLQWDKTSIGVLERLTPQTDGTIEFSVPAATFASSSASSFQAVVEGTMAAVGTSTVNRIIRTAPIVFRFRTDADVSADARYFSDEGVPFGSGPLPPVVAQTTTYRIEWTVTKHLHELQDAVVTATLPKNVTWPNNTNTTVGSVSYDESSRTVTWSLGRMPESVNSVTADFDVQLTPASVDAGRFADLIGETRFQATDVAISEPIVKTKPGVSTDLQNDDGAKGKGVVRNP
jgi:hypothetical protein